MFLIRDGMRYRHLGRIPTAEVQVGDRVGILAGFGAPGNDHRVVKVASLHTEAGTTTIGLDWEDQSIPALWPEKEMGVPADGFCAEVYRLEGPRSDG